MGITKVYTAEKINEHYHFLLSQGATELSVAFDLPTQRGYDSDHEMAGEVGKTGVAIDSIEDMQTLFKGIRLEDVSTSMTITATGYILLAFYTALAKQQGADLKKLNGAIHNDILKEYVTRGSYIYPPKYSMQVTADIFEWCSKELPGWNTLSISGYHLRKAGSTAVQEIAFALSNGKAYVQAAMAKGMDINVFGKGLSFFFHADNHLSGEAAKFRAAREMWARIMKELGTTDPEAMLLRFHTRTGAGTLAEQQIVPFESGIMDTADPLASSFVEALSHEVEEQAWKLIGQIDAMGGSVSAIEQGFIQEEIARSVNKYQVQETNTIPGFKIDDSIRQIQAEKLSSLKRRRDPARCDSILQDLNDKASSAENIIPVVIEAAENFCTLGEIADTLREVFGEYK